MISGAGFECVTKLIGNARWGHIISLTLCTWPKYKYHTCNIQTSTDSFIPIWDFAVLQLRILGASRRTEDFNAVQNRSGILRKISWRSYRCESRDILSWKEKKVFSCLLLMMTIPVIKFRSIGLVGYVWFVNLRF